MMLSDVRDYVESLGISKNVYKRSGIGSRRERCDERRDGIHCQ